jgi:aminodeoxyfutalosine deaminase
MTPPATIPDWLATMPKLEIHVHLEGTMTPEYLVQLVDRHDIEIGINGIDDARAMFDYRDFTHFIETFTTCSDCLKTADDLAGLVASYGAELARQQVRYAEIHFNPEPHFRRKGIAFPDQIAAINDARAGVRRDHGVEMRWIVDGVRDAAIGPKAAAIAVDWMIEAGLDSGIVALGLGGNEIGNPPNPFATTFRRAREAGFHLVAHAGEALGPDSIRDTLDLLEVERIGHGIAAAADPDLMARLAAMGIPLEVSPTSNVCTGVVLSLETHPLPTLRDHGVRFSINSDDPSMFGTTVLEEYAHAARLLELDQSGMANLVEDTIEQSFAPQEVKDRLRRELREHTPAQRKEKRGERK